MEARPRLSRYRSSTRSLTNIGASESLSSSLPVLPTTKDENNPKLPDPQQLCTETEFMPNPLDVFPMSANSGVVGRIFSSPSGLSSDLQYSSVSPLENYAGNAPFILESISNLATMLPRHSSHSGLFQSTTSSQYTKENNNDSWYTDSLRDCFDYSMNTPVQNNHFESSNPGDCGMPSEDLWADQLLTDNDTLTANWNELLADTSVADSEPKMPYQISKPSTNTSMQQPNVLVSGETCGLPAPTSSDSGVHAKPRMRWTPELHEAFVEAVNKLGGSERVLRLLKH